MAIGQRDPHTGHLTTGHEWNGITELNRPVPKIIWWFLISTAIFACVWWVLMPAWPLGESYTRGLLGVDQRTEVARSLAEGEAIRAPWMSRIETGSFEDIQADADLMARVREAGSTLYGDNCSVCHGEAGQGGPGFPRLDDAVWLWGGDAASVATTVRVGINSNHPESRVSQMPAFGRDQMLGRETILNVISYVRSFSEPVRESGETAGSVEAGREVFASNCATCHGESGRGSIEMGAPDLTDGFWIYGGDRAAIFETLQNGRQGHMPSWEDRLTPAERKILAVYFANIGGGRQP